MIGFDDQGKGKTSRLEAWGIRSQGLTRMQDDDFGLRWVGISLRKFSCSLPQSFHMCTLETQQLKLINIYKERTLGIFNLESEKIFTKRDR